MKGFFQIMEQFDTKLSSVISKAVGTKVVPFIYTEVTLIKMDMNDATFQTCFFYDASMFLSDIADFKHAKHTIRKNDIQQRFVC